MNKTSHTDEPDTWDDAMNQSPNAFSNDLTTNQDFNGMVNTRAQRDQGITPIAHDGRGDAGTEVMHSQDPDPPPDSDPPGRRGFPGGGTWRRMRAAAGKRVGLEAVGKRSGSGAFGAGSASHAVEEQRVRTNSRSFSNSCQSSEQRGLIARTKHVLVTFGSFMGPGFLIAVAYIDPGNYATDVAAGASYRFRLLFVILMSNIFAVLLQSLSVKLGSVTGMNLAEANRMFLPRWLNYFLYALGELAIIATDFAEVIGFAIAINLLIPQIPLVAGCIISIADVLAIMFFYRPDGSLKQIRVFEFFVAILVLAVVVCFCIQLSLVQDTTVGEVFKGYIPNNAVAEPTGLYQACGILGATVMPHSLYLGSGLVQSRLRDYDTKHGSMPSATSQEPTLSSGFSSLSDAKSGRRKLYLPSLRAIQHSLKYMYAETALSLFTFALFVNSSILIVAGASLSSNDAALDADLFGIHELLSSSISPAAGYLFAIALLSSGISAGIVCTIAGQMVCEGSLNWRVRPWVRRLATRSISIVPGICIAGALGKQNLMEALTASQVVLSIALPFVTAPLIYYTSRKRYMTIMLPGLARVEEVGPADFRKGMLRGLDTGAPAEEGTCTAGSTGVETTTIGMEGAGAGRGDQSRAESPAFVCMANSWWLCAVVWAVWVVLVAINLANIVLLAMGKT